MTSYYIETSALVKRYRVEQGTGVIDKLLHNPTLEDRYFTSFLTVLEFTSSILRLSKGSYIKENTAAEMIARFRRDLSEMFQIWPVDDEVLSTSITMVEKHLLRSADAIHLATAAVISSILSEPKLVMVSSDQELLIAAANARIQTINPLK